MTTTQNMLVTTSYYIVYQDMDAVPEYQEHIAVHSVCCWPCLRHLSNSYGTRLNLDNMDRLAPGPDFACLNCPWHVAAL